MFNNFYVWNTNMCVYVLMLYMYYVGGKFILALLPVLYWNANINLASIFTLGSISYGLFWLLTYVFEGSA